MSIWPFVYVWKRKCGSVASYPLSQPSPVSGNSHFFVPVNMIVPLSCNPVIASLSLNGLTDMLYICRSPSPEFTSWSSLGILLSHCLHSVRYAGLIASSPRPSHWLEASAHWPLVRISPPSEPTKNLFGSLGSNAIACWSGCIDSPPTSPVASFHVAPESKDTSTARPFERGPTTGETWNSYGPSSS